MQLACKVFIKGKPNFKANCDSINPHMVFICLYGISLGNWGATRKFL